MARRWEDVPAEVMATGRIDEARVAELRRQMLAGIRAYRLVEIRETLGLDPDDITTQRGVTFSTISQLERGDMDHTEIATVRAYLDALGGELELVAKFG